MKSFLIELMTEDSQQAECRLCVCSDNSGVSELGTLGQGSDSPAKFEVIRDELFLTCTRDSIQLKRSGRVRILRTGHAVRLFSGDKIAIHDREVTVKNVVAAETRINTQKFKNISKKAMQAATAALFLTACNGQNVISHLVENNEVGKSSPASYQCMNSPDDKLVQCCMDLSDDEKQECCDLLVELKKSVQCPKPEEDKQAEVIQVICPDKEEI